MKRFIVTTGPDLSLFYFLIDHPVFAVVLFEISLFILMGSSLVYYFSSKRNSQK